MSRGHFPVPVDRVSRIQIFIVPMNAGKRVVFANDQLFPAAQPLFSGWTDGRCEPRFSSGFSINVEVTFIVQWMHIEDNVNGTQQKKIWLYQQNNPFLRTDGRIVRAEIMFWFRTGSTFTRRRLGQLPQELGQLVGGGQS